VGKGARDPKREYLLGIPIARPDDPDPEWVVGVRVAELPRPIPGSSQHDCSSCQQRVWLARSSMHYVARGVKIICPQCLKAFVDTQPKN
jgi:hypothetical protein